MKNGEIQQMILEKITTQKVTVTEVLEMLPIKFTIPAIRYHLDALCMKGKISSITDSRKSTDGRNHKVVLYFKK